MGVEVIDIAIAGGGPGGLATAAALLAAFDGNVKVKVGSIANLGSAQGPIVRHA